MIRKFLSDYFYFTRSEKNGTIVLSVVMVLVFVLPYGYSALKSSGEQKADSVFLEQIENFYAAAEAVLPAEREGTFGQPSVPEAGAQVHPSLSGNPSGPSQIHIDLNSADTLELMKVKGIGPVFSRRILKYRDILGGYCNKLQLLEVYGIDREVYDNIGSFLYADSTKTIKLHLLTDEFGVLLRHPYLDYEQVSQIFKLRDNGSLGSRDDLLGTSSFSIEDVDRLSSYIVFD